MVVVRGKEGMVRGKEGMSPTPNAPSLVEAMRTLYSPSVPEEPSPDVEMAVDEPVGEKVPFTTVTAKKHKGKVKAPPSTNPQTPPQNTPPPSAAASQESCYKAHPCEGGHHTPGAQAGT